ncbi:putative DNA-binding domain-containing protein [Rhizobium sp. SYY.PMSO]|uniref:HvfC/BufC family peptide modification chaperone n=1 Tax=Rhizobium sp. SYY.PMSO TaxID=3382192 RepID=UPI00398FC48F
MRQRPTYADAFSSALVDPDHQTPDVVAGPNGKAAVKRYNVYRNNVTVSLIDSLAAIYPVVQRITGVEFFRAMARFHVRATPPTSPLLFEYGREFPAFIERYEYARGMPWLADTARIERAWLDAYHAADAIPLAAERLSIVPPEHLGELTFRSHPATRVVRSRYAALTIFSANRSTDPVDPIDATEAEDALITRPENEVEVRHLPEGGAVFLTALISGQTLATAAAAAMASAPNFDLPASISGMFTAGAFTGLDFGATS